MGKCMRKICRKHTPSAARVIDKVRMILKKIKKMHTGKYAELCANTCAENMRKYVQTNVRKICGSMCKQMCGKYAETYPLPRPRYKQSRGRWTVHGQAHAAT